MKFLLVIVILFLAGSAKARRRRLKHKLKKSDKTEIEDILENLVELKSNFHKYCNLNDHEEKKLNCLFSPYLNSGKQIIDPTFKGQSSSVNNKILNNHQTFVEDAIDVSAYLMKEILENGEEEINDEAITKFCIELKKKVKSWP